jgi:hypothetical protein
VRIAPESGLTAMAERGRKMAESMRKQLDEYHNVGAKAGGFAAYATPGGGGGGPSFMGRSVPPSVLRDMKQRAEEEAGQAADAEEAGQAGGDGASLASTAGQVDVPAVQAQDESSAASTSADMDIVQADGASESGSDAGTVNVETRALPEPVAAAEYHRYRAGGVPRRVAREAVVRRWGVEACVTLGERAGPEAEAEGDVDADADAGQAFPGRPPFGPGPGHAGYPGPHAGYPGPHGAHWFHGMRGPHSHVHPHPHPSFAPFGPWSYGVPPPWAEHAHAHAHAHARQGDTATPGDGARYAQHAFPPWMWGVPGEAGASHGHGHGHGHVHGHGHGYGHGHGHGHGHPAQVGQSPYFGYGWPQW